MNKIIKIGHRGACGYEPENTLRSFQKAIEFGVDMIELDVRGCMDNELVVIHDDTLERTTNGHGYVHEKNLGELQSLDAGNGEKIPALREAFDLISRKTKINIELKEPEAVKPVAGLIEDYVNNRGWSYDDFLVSSFNHYELWTIKGLNPAIKTGALIEMVPDNFAEFAKELNVYSVHINAGTIDEKIIEDLHRQEIKVFVWTVDAVEEIQRMKKLGVDGIFSNFPDRL